jgi:hypothetical protein
VFSGDGNLRSDLARGGPIHFAASRIVEKEYARCTIEGVP